MSLNSIKVISRNPDEFVRETKYDIHKIQRNYDKKEHPFHAQREYKLAVNAAKLERVFAKPFVASFTHRETVSSIAKHPFRLSCIFTGTVEGELYQWNLKTRKKEWMVQAHDNQIYAISAFPNGDSFFTVGSDRCVKRWSVKELGQKNDTPEDTWLCGTSVSGISHNRETNDFVTCGDRVLLWDVASKAPKVSYDWNFDKHQYRASVQQVKFNPIEKNIFAAIDRENNIMLYDTREKDVRKYNMRMRINSIDWNPMESYILSGASSDYHCYTFDIRKFDGPDRIFQAHKGHTNDVLDLSYSPTGKEICSGSTDHSIRIFEIDKLHSREIYHTKRMYQINCVLWSGDNEYVMSGSSDYNLRVWKAYASQKMGTMSGKELDSYNASLELRNKYKHYPEVSRISKKRHLPKKLHHEVKEIRLMENKIRRKEENLRKSSKPGTVPYTTTKTEAFGAEQEMQISLEDYVKKHDEK